MGSPYYWCIIASTLLIIITVVCAQDDQPFKNSTDFNDYDLWNNGTSLDPFSIDDSTTDFNTTLFGDEFLDNGTSTATSEDDDLDNVTVFVRRRLPDFYTVTEKPPHPPTIYEEAQCVDGLLMKAWKPTTNLTVGDRTLRGLFYFLILCYLFLGVSIVSDRFMSAIERITAQEREVKVRKPDGTSHVVVVRVWNETVANLTLMALGTSAPEILLSIIEIFSKNFQAGELGPGTIVGSAAYNLFSIIALCIVVIPNGEVRRIKHLRVFFVTATFSIFAYIWMYLILAYFSPGRVEIWEGLLTFMFFPITVCTAFIADRRMFVYKYLNKEYRMNKRGVMVQSEGADIELNGRPRIDSLSTFDEGKELLAEDYTDFETARREYIGILRELRQKYPQYDKENLEIMAQEQLMNNGPKSRAFYRIQATRKMVGSGNIMRKVAERAQNDLVEVKSEFKGVEIGPDDGTPFIRFEPAHYTVMESCGEFEIRVMRRGDFSSRVTVDFETQDGSAEAGTDYIAKKGTLIFTPGVDERFIKIQVIDDDIYEQDEQFFVILTNVTGGASLGKPSIATVMILDDDHGGIFSLAEKEFEAAETVGTFELKVQRYSGARGTVIVPYWTDDGTAKAGKDYEAIKGELVFENNETE